MKENLENSGNSSPKPNVNRIRAATQEVIPSPKGEGIQNLHELKRVKQEVVENVIKKEKNGNPTPTRIQVVPAKDAQEVANDGNFPAKERTAEEARKESTIEWVHRRFGTNKEELRQLNVTTNHSYQEIPSQTHDDSGQLDEFNEVNSAKALWSDEVEVIDDQQGTTKATGNNEKRDNTQLQKTAILGMLQ